MSNRRAPHSRPAPSVYEAIRNADTRFFAENPDVCGFARLYIPGEVPVAFPPGTLVVVEKIGADRKRTFLAPDVQGN